MKRLLRNSIGFLLMWPLSFLLISSAEAVTEHYQLDPNHSFVEWHINHFGFSNPSGKWFAEGTLVLDQNKPENSQVDVVIPITHFVTGIDKLDEHLKSSTFFDVAKFPTATFVSNKVTLMGKDKAQVQGTLTLHGIAKPVTLNVTLNKMGISPISKKPTVGFTATTVLKRSDFGMSAFSPGLSDKVFIHIEAEAFKTN